MLTKFFLLFLFSIVACYTFGFENSMPITAPHTIGLLPLTDPNRFSLQFTHDGRIAFVQALNGGYEFKFSICNDSLCSAITNNTQVNLISGGNSIKNVDLSFANGVPQVFGFLNPEENNVEIVTCMDPMCSSGINTYFFSPKGGAWAYSISKVVNLPFSNTSVMLWYQHRASGVDYSLKLTLCTNQDCTFPNYLEADGGFTSPAQVTYSADVTTCRDSSIDRIGIISVSDVGLVISVATFPGNGPSRLVSGTAFDAFDPSISCAPVSGFFYFVDVKANNQNEPSLYICTDPNCDTNTRVSFPPSTIRVLNPKILFPFGNDIPVIVFSSDDNNLYAIFCNDEQCSVYDNNVRILSSLQFAGDIIINPFLDGFMYIDQNNALQNFHFIASPPCSSGQYIDLSALPGPSCKNCAPVLGKLVNPWPNKNVTCLAVDPPSCLPGYKVVLNGTGAGCSICPAANYTGGYNFYGPTAGDPYSCVFTLGSNCAPGQFSNASGGPISWCVNCPDANSTGAYNTLPGRFPSCVFEEYTTCGNNEYVQINGASSSCQDCLDANELGSYNPLPSASLSCTFVAWEDCPPNTYLSLNGPHGSCAQCPNTISNLGSFNPEPNINTTCVFVLSGKSCAPDEDIVLTDSGVQICQPKPKAPPVPDSTPLYSALGGAAVICSFVAFRWKQAAKKSHVEYRDVVSFAGGTASKTMKEDAIPPPGTPFVNVLSLDGGGMRGLSLIYMLTMIQQKIDISNIPSIFHLIGGTSTGGLLAFGLQSGRSLETAKQLYEQLGSKVFKSSYRIPIVRLTNQILGKSLYSGDQFETMLRGVFGEEPLYPEDPDNTWPKAFGVATLSSVDPPIEYLFRTYLVNEDTQSYAGCSSNEDWLLWEAARATSAAPIFFPEFSRKSDASLGGGHSRLWADGALYHNNPSRVVLSEALSLWGDDLKFALFLSLGTGNVVSSNSGSKSSLGWAKTLASIVTNSERAHRELEQSLNNMTYYRFNPPLPSAIPLDSASQSDLEILELLTTGYMSSASTQGRLIELSERIMLTAPHISPKIPYVTREMAQKERIQLHPGIHSESRQNNVYPSLFAQDDAPLTETQQKILLLQNQLAQANNTIVDLQRQLAQTKSSGSGSGSKIRDRAQRLQVRT